MKRETSRAITSSLLGFGLLGLAYQAFKGFERGGRLTQFGVVTLVEGLSLVGFCAAQLITTRREP